MIVLLASGFYAVSAIPKESTPDIAIPLGVVSTVLPGASSSDVERLVTDKIEKIRGYRKRQLCICVSTAFFFLRR